MYPNNFRCKTLPKGKTLYDSFSDFSLDGETPKPEGQVDNSERRIDVTIFSVNRGTNTLLSEGRT